jgi:hypothetical protein
LKHDSNISSEEKNNNKERLLEYCNRKLFSTKNKDEAFCIVTDYAGKIDTIVNDYRNPSAHTNRLTRTKAKECFDYLLDVEKFIKKMLDSFDE